MPRRLPLLAASAAALCLPLMAAAKTIRVAADGTGDAKTLAEAIAAVPDRSAERTTIRLGPGTYAGQTIVPKTKANVTLEGAGTDETVCTFAYNINEPNPPSVVKKYKGIGFVVLADGFEARGLTFQNTSGDHGQALALRIDADRAVVIDCRLVGWQDTLRVDDGRSYFRDDAIAGRVDFIYGSGTAVFDHCQVHSRNGGFVTAANTPAGKPYGFVFLDCKLTGDAVPYDPATTNPANTQKPRVTPKAYLGRPWRPFASVVYVRCELGPHILPAGWQNWNSPANEKTARYAEYADTGPGAAPAARVPWSHQLTAGQAAQLTVPDILGGTDHWDPTADLPKPTK